MKRILIIAAMPFPQEKGSSLRVLEIIKILSKKYAVDVLCYASKQETPVLANVRIIRTPAWYTPPLKVAKPGFIKLSLDLLLIIKGFWLVTKNKYDILQGEDFEGACAVRFLSLFRPKAKIVYDFHNFVADNLSLQRKTKKRNFLTKVLSRIEEKNIQRADLMILNWMGHSKAAVFAKKKTVVFRDTVTLEQANVDIPKTRYALYSGNFESYQGIEFLLDCYRQSKQQIKLALVGKTTPKIQKQIDALGIQDKVILTGSLPLEKTNTLIAHAEFCLWPIQINAKSMKVIHYLLHGKPILTTGNGNSDDLLQDGDNAAVARSRQDFIKSLNTLSQDRNYLLKLTSGAAQTSLELRKESDPEILYADYRKL